MMDITRLVACTDNILLRPDATASDIEQLCAEAQQFHFFGVCVHGSWVQSARRMLLGTSASVAIIKGEK